MSIDTRPAPAAPSNRPLPEAIPVRRRRPRRLADVLSGGGVHLLLIAMGLFSVVPILIVLMNSFKTTQGIFGAPFALPDAETFNLQGYINVFTRGNFLLNYQNSLIVTLATIVLTIVLGTLAAWALVEYKVPITPVLAGFFVVGIMLPIRLGTVPLIKIMTSWGLMDTLTALILVYTAMQLPLAIALMTTYFRAVPNELKEAARIDGAGEWRTLGITLPIVRVGIAAVASITMLPVWNDLWFPLILAPNKQNQTVTLGVQQFVGQFQNDYPALLASLTLGAVPLVILFAVFSRQYIAGLTKGYGK
ncbi:MULTISPECIES: carbohydrate ABC transporter permease [Microbacterium]|uniref:Carbohydrate ABC transporter permease n=1 Tax=Microbacterium aurugineum TaxID=2851642 RepID=A0ABY4IX42_9MICO|nr:MULTISPECIES: carbohydrate ABC transporter permease [Microbacterium]QEA27703.1 carbohydrate ABC transporter permease [Microbacterium sp. CBA3102]UPL16401.1 carbohydrate ABC transporter permease [Microbacterium aurugineum]